MTSYGNAPIRGATSNTDQQMDEDERIEQLKTALWLPLGNLVDSVTVSENANATPQFIGALTEMVWGFLEGAAGGVEAFARHADRTTVTVKDVLLLARRNKDLEGVLQRWVEEGRRRGT